MEAYLLIFFDTTGSYWLLHKHFIIPIFHIMYFDQGSGIHRQLHSTLRIFYNSVWVNERGRLGIIVNIIPDGKKQHPVVLM